MRVCVCGGGGGGGGGGELGKSLQRPERVKKTGQKNRPLWCDDKWGLTQDYRCLPSHEC